jgi:hypothetical protein
MEYHVVIDMSIGAHEKVDLELKKFEKRVRG